MSVGDDPRGAAGGPLDASIIAELRRSIEELAPALRPERAARFIIALAEGQAPGAELRSAFLSIAAAALLGAAACQERRRAASQFAAN